MRRIALVLALIGGVACLWLLPRGDGARIAALETHTLLKVELGGDGPTQRIGDALLDGPATVHDSPRHATFVLYGLRFIAVDPPTDDPNVHDLARRSFIRGLREIAAERGISLDVDGEAMPTVNGSRNGANILIGLDGPKLSLQYTHPAGARMHVERDDFAPASQTSLLPPLVAIALAILLRRPVLALFAGVACAAVLLRLHGGATAPAAVAWALPDVATKMLWPEIASATNLLIVGFTLATLAMVGVMTRSGGVRGIVDAVARRARTPRSAQFATWLVGVLVFFDDYVSCILVGSTMRRVTDGYRISREKLAYLVDSTAAPVASLALFSSWIAFQVSTFAPQLPSARLSAEQGYAVFVEALPFRFYSVFTIFLAAAVALSGRDLGPMLKAERRARTTGKLQRDGARPMTSDDGARLEPANDLTPRARRAIVPVLVFVLVTLFEIVRVGFAELSRLDGATKLGSLLSSARGLTELLAHGNSNRAMCIGACAGLAAAALYAFAAGLRGEIASAALRMLKATFAGIAILYCAWMIGSASGNLGTATYLTEMLGDKLAPQLLPCLLFLLACGVAFATGTSWGTMSMLLPLVVGLAYSIGDKRFDFGGGHALMVMSIAAVIEGAIFGDHCSPLASTTILSSISSSADLIDHVQTQLPYGLIAFALALTAGWFPIAFFGWSPWLSLAVGCAALLMIVFVFGRRETPRTVEAPLSTAPEP